MILSIPYQTFETENETNDDLNDEIYNNEVNNNELNYIFTETIISG